MGALEYRHGARSIPYAPVTGDVVSKAVVEPMLETKGDYNSDSVTFYRSFRTKADVSFCSVADTLQEGFERIGYECEGVDGYSSLWAFNIQGMKTKDNIALIYPAFAHGLGGIKLASSFHKRVVIMEVADTTRINPNTLEMLNNKALDCIIVPSSFSKFAFIESGVHNRIEVIPHALHPAYTSKPIKMEKRDKPRILYFSLHSQYRKGEKVVMDAVSQLKTEFDFEVWAKAGGERPWADRHIIGYLTYEEMVNLYDSCDILLSASRGGAFELNPLEAMSRGLIVLTPVWGGSGEYADLHHCLTVGVSHYTRVFHQGIHIGMGVEPNLDDFINKLRYALNNLDALKKHALKNAKKVQERFDCAKIAKRFVEVFKTL